MRIGIFGGSFNPPHLAHLIVAEHLRNSIALDRVYWIPGSQPPHKDVRSLAPGSHRYEMVKLATSDHPSFHVSDLELQREGPSFTIDTIRELKRRNPDDAFFLLMGGDSLSEFHRWKDPEEILEEVPLVVYRRPGSEVPVALVGSERVVVAETPLIEISGTDIRRRVARGESIRYLVPDAVIRFIDANNLYRQ